MNDPQHPTTPATRRWAPHPLDFLVLLLAVVLAVVAYAYLFKTSPVSVPADRWLGARLTVEFAADRPWKATFPTDPEQALQIEGYINARPLGTAVDSPDRPGFRRLELEVLGRESQRVDRLSAFRDGIRRGALLQLHDQHDEVQVEVVAVVLAPEAEADTQPGTSGSDEGSK